MTEYSVVDFGRMVLDDARRDAYLGAIAAHVTPTSRVLDLGCGTGFFTIAALRAGAAHVTAIDLAEAARVVPDVCRANGLADRVSVWLGDVRKLDTEPFDVVISDLRGVVPLYGKHLEVIAEVRERLLAPGGILLPSRDRLNVALATHPVWRRRLERLADIFPGDWSAALDLVALTPTHEQLDEDVLASTEGTWAEVDYADVAGLRRRHVGGQATVTTSDQRVVDGLAVWFDAEIDEAHGFTTRPSPAEPTYRRMFLPLGEGLVVEAGESVVVRIDAFRTGSGWSWKWSAESSGGRRECSTLDHLPLNRPSEMLNSDRSGPIELYQEVTSG